MPPQPDPLILEALHAEENYEPSRSSKASLFVGEGQGRADSALRLPLVLAFGVTTHLTQGIPSQQQKEGKRRPVYESAGGSGAEGGQDLGLLAAAAKRAKDASNDAAATAEESSNGVAPATAMSLDNDGGVDSHVPRRKRVASSAHDAVAEELALTLAREREQHAQQLALLRKESFEYKCVAQQAQEAEERLQRLLREAEGRATAKAAKRHENATDEAAASQKTSARVLPAIATESGVPHPRADAPSEKRGATGKRAGQSTSVHCL
jgi:hypothetical protein